MTNRERSRPESEHSALDARSVLPRARVAVTCGLVLAGAARSRWGQGHLLLCYGNTVTGPSGDIQGPSPKAQSIPGAQSWAVEIAAA